MVKAAAPRAAAGPRAGQRPVGWRSVRGQRPVGWRNGGSTQSDEEASCGKCKQTRRGGDVCAHQRFGQRRRIAEQHMSVMLSFNHELWEDEEYHESQRQSNPHWRCKKEVYSYFQPGHFCAYCASDCAICHTRNEECGVNCDGRYSCYRQRYWLAQTCAFAVLVPLISGTKLPNQRPVAQGVSVRWQRSWHGWTTELSSTASIGNYIPVGI